MKTKNNEEITLQVKINQTRNKSKIEAGINFQTFQIYNVFMGINFC